MSDETQRILHVEDERFRAMVSSDISALDRLLASDLHYVHANGIIEDKPEFIRKIVVGERIYKRFEVIDRHTRQEGQLMLVFGEVNVEVDRPAGPLKNVLTYTAVYRLAAEPAFFVWHAVKSASG